MGRDRSKMDSMIAMSETKSAWRPANLAPTQLSDQGPPGGSGMFFFLFPLYVFF